MSTHTTDALCQLWRAGPSAERDSVIDDIARDVSKTGELSFCDEVLNQFRSFFTTEECVELYVQIRDASGRLEEEWRDEFIDYFPDCENALPPPDA